MNPINERNPITMKKPVQLAALMIAVLMFACDSDPTIQEGVASWYGPGFHGQRTSSGDVYNENDTTAAHRTLPFDTVVRVVNLDNDEAVEVRINDRGPYADDRIIDLSRAAGEAIGMIDSGTARVRLELVDAGGDIPGDLDQEWYTIQVAEYNGSLYAKRLVDEIGSQAYIEQEHRAGRTRYMIYYGRYNQTSQARLDLESLREEGYDGFIKQIQ